MPNSRKRRFSGVTLPIRLQNVLTKAALKEKLVMLARPLREANYKAEILPGVDEVEEKQRRVALAALERRLNPYHKQRVLEALLLFGKVFLVSNMFFDYRPLVEEGFAELYDPLEYDPIGEFNANRARHTRPVFEAYEYLSHPTGSDFVRDFDTYCDLLAELEVVKDPELLSNTSKAFYEARLGAPFLACLVKAHIFMLGVHDIENWLFVSTHRAAPLLITVPPSVAKPHLVEDRRMDAHDVLVAYAIFLDEIGSVPVLDSFSDLKRLLKHPALPDFRYAVWAWADAIGRGQAADEAMFRKHIAKSIAALGTATSVRRVSRYVTYMSLPVAVASLLIQFPLGLTLLPMSLGLRLTADVLESRHQWVTFGR